MRNLRLNYVPGRLGFLFAFVCMLAVSQRALAQESVTRSSEAFDKVARSLNAAADTQLVAVQEQLFVDGNSVSGATADVKPEGGLNRSARDGSDFRRSERAMRFESMDVGARRIFDDVGVPAEFLAVAKVESNFNPAALSRKGAFGVWQLMPETARRYGLRVDGERDERSDAEKSTRVAARYLRDLHLQFQDWLLALAAYNAGEGLVQKAVTRAGTTDFWSLSSQGHLPAETRNYVPAVLAAMNLNGGRSFAKPRTGRERAKGEIVFAGFAAPASNEGTRFVSTNSGEAEGR